MRRMVARWSCHQCVLHDAEVLKPLPHHILHADDAFGEPVVVFGPAGFVEDVGFEEVKDPKAGNPVGRQKRRGSTRLLYC
jgi:hypothetical protein